MTNFVVHNGYKGVYTITWNEQDKWITRLSFANNEGQTCTYEGAAYSQSEVIKRTHDAWANMVDGGIVGNQHKEAFNG
jgi:hypothetical protein